MLTRLFYKFIIAHRLISIQIYLFFQLNRIVHKNLGINLTQQNFYSDNPIHDVCIYKELIFA